MNRAVYLAGFGYIAVCGALIYRARQVESVVPLQVASQVTGSDAQSWFAGAKARCNTVEVDVLMQWEPAPGSTDGSGFEAACYALAGRIEQARAVIEELPARDRYVAAGIVFEVGHPVADAGDDASAGPIMELVIDYWPNHHMALYHAAMAEYGLGQNDRVREHLTEFLDLYEGNDGWRSNAIEVLARLDAELGDAR